MKEEYYYRCPKCKRDYTVSMYNEEPRCTFCETMMEEVFLLYVEYPADDVEHIRQMDGMIERVVGQNNVHTGTFFGDGMTRDMEFEIAGKEKTEEIVKRLRDEIHKSCGPLFLEEFRTKIINTK